MTELSRGAALRTCGAFRQLRGQMPFQAPGIFPNLPETPPRRLPEPV